ncbi:SWIB/MDM2 domain, Homeodomain-like, DEK [Artemisia annua]|uniref:SWIB/MDM2 domain, Homeodomain-like, DEK n=1 Tax=Artemisia annua TaxID=35608 RepID=A0A2U1PGZ6_ARTAN|nr:SWIB/MDM2 domain, Homeodomain-like, DEK [Artemisia annua]
MVSDQEIAKGVEILLSKKSFNSLTDVVHQLSEKLGFDLSHKIHFIRDHHFNNTNSSIINNGVKNEVAGMSLGFPVNLALPFGAARVNRFDVEDKLQALEPVDLGELCYVGFVNISSISAGYALVVVTSSGVKNWSQLKLLKQLPNLIPKGLQPLLNTDVTATPLPVQGVWTKVCSSGGLVQGVWFRGRGNGTIVVITKLDIMDRSTDACNLLLRKTILLCLGYAGVVNHSQEDQAATMCKSDSLYIK